MKEIEDKFLIDNIQKTHSWDKEFIIYQWYSEITADSSIKYKILFDMNQLSCIFVKIRKFNMQSGCCDKEVIYFKENEFPWDQLFQYPFVMKQRSIQNKVFLDHFLRSNQICEYLVEIEYAKENDKNQELKFDAFTIVEKVTSDIRYLNQNMTISFEKQDQEYLNILLQIFL